MSKNIFLQMVAKNMLKMYETVGIDDLFEGKIMDIVDFKFKPKPNPDL